MIDHAFIDRKRRTIAQLEQNDMTTIDKLNALPNPFMGVHLPPRKPSGPQYSRAAVEKAIAASNRAGRKIGKREAARIHALLKGPY